MAGCRRQLSTQPGRLTRAAGCGAAQPSGPLGVDQPRFTHPETQDEVVDATISRARDTVAELWQARANAAKPLDPRCNVDCAGQHRIACAVGEQQCGACLPGYAEFADSCHRRTSDRNDPRHDERYTSSGVFAAPSGQARPRSRSPAPPTCFVPSSIWAPPTHRAPPTTPGRTPQRTRSTCLGRQRIASPSRRSTATTASPS